MTNETQQLNTSEQNHIPFGTRLKTAREALSLERRDVAAQLRLNEKVIMMMEKDRYPADLPVTFIRGYLRAYGKLLELPEPEIKKAVEPIKPKIIPNDPLLVAKTKKPPINTRHYFMQFSTYLIVLTLIGLVGVWWYSHSLPITNFIAENIPPSILPNSSSSSASTSSVSTPSQPISSEPTTTTATTTMPNETSSSSIPAYSTPQTETNPNQSASQEPRADHPDHSSLSSSELDSAISQMNMTRTPTENNTSNSNNNE